MRLTALFLATILAISYCDDVHIAITPIMLDDVTEVIPDTEPESTANPETVPGEQIIIIEPPAFN